MGYTMSRTGRNSGTAMRAWPCFCHQDSIRRMWAQTANDPHIHTDGRTINLSKNNDEPVEYQESWNAMKDKQWMLINTKIVIMNLQRNPLGIHSEISHQTPSGTAWIELGPFWGMIRQSFLHRSCNLPGVSKFEARSWRYGMFSIV